MYADYWRLKEKPFENSLDMRFVYMADQHKEGLARMIYAAEQHKSGAILTGDYGTGKSLVRQMFINKLGKVGSFAVASIDNPLIGFDAVLADIRDQISEKSCSFSSVGAVMRELREVFKERKLQGFHNLILVENSQLLQERHTFNQLRLLMDLCDDHGQPLVSLIFFGQSDILKIVRQSKALDQRITSRWTLSPLSPEQTRGYITHRLSVAGGNGWIIGDDAVVAIHDYAGGIARLINNVSDLALYLGMSENAVRVDASMVVRVIKDLKHSLPVAEER